MVSVGLRQSRAPLVLQKGSVSAAGEVLASHSFNAGPDVEGPRIEIISETMPLLKHEWVRFKIGPLLFIDRMVSNDAASYALVKAEAAAGGSRRRAFTRA